MGTPFARVATPILATAALFAYCATVTEPAATAATERASAAVTAANWDAGQQHQVVAAGLMSDRGASFDGAGHLSAAQANATMVALAARLQSAVNEQAANEPVAAGEQGSSESGATGEQGATGSSASSGPSAAPSPTVPVAHTTQSPVRLVTFDRMVIDELGLSDVASHVQMTAATAGLRPPAYFGSEVVARFLELRYEHPVGTQRLDLFPNQAITRAEAAWSLARVTGLGEWSVADVREALSAFELPRMTAAQRRVLRIAVSRIGYPYVWGGTTDNTSDGLEHGGFDCSGFAWRVYKVSGLPWGNQIQGRTAAEQAGEIPKSRRLRVAQLAPGDLLFFGTAHLNGSSTEKSIDHEGIYLGDNWVIHSSSQGVYVLPLQGSWLGDSFAWGRRVIR